MATHTLSETAKASIKQKLDASTKSIPGCVFVATNAAGDDLFSHAAGLRGLSGPEAMTLDSVFWIASCTKMVTGIACMQLVEQGKLKLEDVESLEKLLPELKKVQVLEGWDDSGKVKLREKKNGITLKMLLCHTAGFGYTFFNPEVRKFGFPAGIDHFSGRSEDNEHPLLFDPGSKFNYGTNIDWAGIAVERVSGLTLNAYFQKFIFEPLGIQNTSFFPTAFMKANLASMHQRYTDGKLITREHLIRAPLYNNTAAQEAGIFCAGGAGLFSQPKEYVKIISTLLNNGVSPHTSKRILAQATVEQMFTNQIPEFPNFGRELIADAIPELTNKIPELYSQPIEEAQGWGLTFMLTIHKAYTGRGGNTGWWAGLPNLFWWCDREHGVGGMIATQILPFADPNVLGLWVECEKAVYDG